MKKVLLTCLILLIMPFTAMAHDEADLSQPLSTPIYSDIEIRNWTSTAITTALTFQFNSIPRDLKNSSRYFTPKGWDSFYKALQKSRIIETVQSRHQIVTTTIMGSPIIQSQRDVEGVYEWVVMVPIVTTYQAGKESKSQKLLATVVINRTNDAPQISGLEKSPYGIGINQAIMVPR